MNTVLSIEVDSGFVVVNLSLTSIGTYSATLQNVCPMLWYDALEIISGKFSQTHCIIVMLA